MRETRFIQQNREKWEDFEKFDREKQNDPEKMGRFFVEITDDLSYARTFYANRSVRVYLNNVAQQLFLRLSNNKPLAANEFLNFWKIELPQLVYEARREMLLATLIFFFAFGIGVLSTVMDPEFPRVILGDDYVDQTLENIRKGDPMAVYKDPDAAGMAWGITWNNLRVALLTFILGVFFSGGTVGFLLYNGIMVGAFQFFFYKQGVFVESFLTIWIHGTLEISSIVIAGAAGLVLGKGLVFPGTYTRMQAFQLSGRRGLKIFMGVAPIIVLAGLIEGFVTRFTDAPHILRLLFILLSFGFVIGYFRWYAWRVAKREVISAEQETRLPPTQELAINFNKVKETSELFGDTFAFMRQNFGKLFANSAKVSLLATIAVLLFERFLAGGESYFNFDSPSFFGIQMVEWFFKAFYTPWANASQFFSSNSVFSPLMLVNLIVFVTTFWLALRQLASLYQPEAIKTRAYILQSLLATTVIGAIVMFLFSADALVVWLAVLAIIPFLLLVLGVVFIENQNILKAFGEGFNLLRAGFATMVGIYFVMLLMCYFVVMLLTADSSELVLSFLNWQLTADPATGLFVKKTGMLFLYYTVFGFAFPLVAVGLALCARSLTEVTQANWLRARISTIGERKTVYGLEQESNF